jgi:hypothetical protein
MLRLVRFAIVGVRDQQDMMFMSARERRIGLMLLDKSSP